MKALLIAVLAVSSVATALGQTPATGSDSEAQAIQQWLDDGEYAIAEREARAWYDVQQRSSLSTSDTAINLLVAALVANGKAGAAETLTLARRVIPAQDQPVTRQTQAVISLRNLGDLHVARGEFAAALPFYDRAMGLLRRPPETASDLLADVLDGSAAALIRLDRVDEAEARLDESERLQESKGSNTSLAFARTLRLKALLLRYRGDYAQAVTALERALRVQRDRAQRHPDLVLSLQILGDIRFLGGNPLEAEQAWKEALDIANARLQPRHPMIAFLLHRLYSAAKAKGEMSEARRLIEEANRVGAASYGPCDQEVPGLLSDLAATNMYEGDYANAQRLFAQALRFNLRCLGPNHSLTATVLDNQGTLAMYMGDAAGAARLFQRAIRIWSVALGSNHPYVARGLDDFAEVFAPRQPRRARSLYQRSLDIRRRSLGPDHPDVAWTLTNLATVTAADGDLSNAANQINEALRIYRRGGLPQEPDHLARALELRGMIEMRRSDFAQARTTFGEALMTRQALFGADHPLAAASRAHIAAAELAVGNSGVAQSTALDAELIGLDHLRFTIRYLPERQAMEYAAARPRGLDLALSVAAGDPMLNAARLFDIVIRARGVILDELAARAQATSANSDPGVASLNASMLTARRRFATLMLRSLEGDDAVPTRLLDEARQQKEDAERALAERNVAALQEAQRAHTGLNEVRRAMPSRAALVSFVRYDRTSVVDRSSGRTVATTPSYIALVTRTDSPDIRVIPLGGAASLERLVDAWRLEAGGRAIVAADEPREAEAKYRAAGTALRTRLWDPLAESLKGVARVFIVPDGALNLVSFAALPTGNRYLLETGPTIHYLSTERDLVRTDGAEGRGLLALGGPAFDTRAAAATGVARRSGCGAIGSLRFEDLPGSRAEVQDIARIWGEPADVLLLSGRAATKAALTKAIVGRKVVHLATHGFFLGSECDAAIPQTRGVGGIVRAVATAPIDNPLLLSGLALAGVNTLSGARQSNGILNAEEISGLNLQGTEWVVLSACDTGLGQVTAGEGVFGLRRALQIAGVHTIIMSLWSVEDQSTRDWMKALYTARLSRQLDTPDAVRAAGIQILEQRRKRNLSTHPFYWAAFVAAGDWR